MTRREEIEADVARVVSVRPDLRGLERVLRGIQEHVDRTGEPTTLAIWVFD